MNDSIPIRSALAHRTDRRTASANSAQRSSDKSYAHPRKIERRSARCSMAGNGLIRLDFALLGRRQLLGAAALLAGDRPNAFHAAVVVDLVENEAGGIADSISRGERPLVARANPF